MYAMKIDLHKISLGALIISLGMLVDDAIVVVELMEVKMSEGWERTKAASYAFRTCAWPLLTGTVITCLGFMPIAFSDSSSSEFCYTLFPVMTITLLLSWVISATLAPVLGHEWLKPTVIKQESYDTPFYKKFRSLLNFSLTHRALVLGITVILFVVSIFMMRFIRQEFFPASVRPDLLVELNLPEGSSIKTTDAAAQKLTKLILDDEDLDRDIAQDEPFCYAFALSDMEHDKSTAYPRVNTIVFDEFLTRQIYLQDEFVVFMNVLSTIIRRHLQMSSR